VCVSGLHQCVALIFDDIAVALIGREKSGSVLPPKLLRSAPPSTYILSANTPSVFWIF